MTCGFWWGLGFRVGVGQFHRTSAGGFLCNEPSSKVQRTEKAGSRITVISSRLRVLGMVSSTVSNEVTVPNVPVIIITPPPHPEVVLRGGLLGQGLGPRWQ